MVEINLTRHQEDALRLTWRDWEMWVLVGALTICLSMAVGFALLVHFYPPY